MGIFGKRPVFAAAAIVAAGGILAGGLALKPAIAADGSMSLNIGPFALVKCTNTTACQTYQNKSTGAGVEGDAKNGIGVKGTSTAGIGMTATSSTGDGIVGVSTSNAGVVGESSTGSAVYGNSSSGNGVYAYSNGSSAIYADGGSYALEAHGFGGNPAVYAYPFGSGAAAWFDATGSGSYGSVNYSSGAPSVWAYNYAGNGGDLSGTYIGVVGRSTAGSGFPFVATDLGGNNLFWVDGNGQAFAHGYNTFAPTHNGGSATAFGAQSASPTIEDNGTAQLVNGTAMVKLDPTFAQTIDTRKPYQVMLTPDGDTRGLFIASKSVNGFVVREVQGGRSSISFDYHIYAPVTGRSNDRMTLVGRSMLGAGGPKAAVAAPARIKPSKEIHHH